MPIKFCAESGAVRLRYGNITASRPIIRTFRSSRNPKTFAGEHPEKALPEPAELS
jgi:hypothetical protein